MYKMMTSATNNQRHQNGTKEASNALQNAQAAAASELLQVIIYCFPENM